MTIEFEYAQHSEWPDRVIDRLNELGRDGWLLVSGPTPVPYVFRDTNEPVPGVTFIVARLAPSYGTTAKVPA